MDLGLTGKRALVTGSTAGIGFATARALAREGAHVTINGRTHDRVSQASTDEIASMIAYVCSAQASATTGAALVDGGVVRSIA